MFGVSSVQLRSSKTHSVKLIWTPSRVWRVSLLYKQKIWMPAEKVVSCYTTPNTHNHIHRHPSTLLFPPYSHPHMPHAPVLPLQPPILHSCQAATCSLQHAAQLLCYNNKLRSIVAGRSHYLQLLLWMSQGAISDQLCVWGTTGFSSFFVYSEGPMEGH